jgi:hypothetical protein
MNAAPLFVMLSRVSYAPPVSPCGDVDRDSRRQDLAVRIARYAIL